jgi:hypothetical protein
MDCANPHSKSLGFEKNFLQYAHPHRPPHCQQRPLQFERGIVCLGVALPILLMVASATT